MTHVEYGFENDGRANLGFTTIRGNTWIGTGTRTDSKGKVYKTRSEGSFSPDGKAFKTKWEYSPDNGITWLRFLEFTMTKEDK